MDIVEFIEKLYKLPLMEYQKEFIRTYYDAIKNNEQLIYVPSRGHSIFQFSTLQALTVIAFAQERGLVELNLDKEDI